MDDIMSKINSLLSDEESVRQLSELAEMLVSDYGSNNNNKNENVSTSSDSQPDLESMLKITSLIGEASKTDKNADLLLALKPHLGEEKQKRVDKAIKLLKLMAILNIAKESGVLKELI